MLVPDDERVTQPEQRLLYKIIVGQGALHLGHQKVEGAVFQLAQQKLE